MTHSLRVLGVFATLAASAPAWSDDAPAAEEPTGEDDDVLAPYRLPFEVLAERAIGTASTPVEFNWRDTTAQIGLSGHHPFELNNFNSIRGGVVGRFPAQTLMFEVGVSYVWVWDSPSSELLALTPYRQPGRPPRTEIDFTIGVPLAEGVVTTYPRFFPAVQLVFSAYAGVRYLLYPTAFSGMRIGEIAGAVFSPTITRSELDNLEDNRLDAMQVDPARYGLLAGVGNDIYFRQGLFISPRLMLAVPILAPATETELLLWADISLAVGVAF
ncbi:MAG: hypothetical protein AAFV53_38195 [Myxococcota bacterium]